MSKSEDTTALYPFLVLPIEGTGDYVPISQFGETQGQTVEETLLMAKRSLVDLSSFDANMVRPISDEQLIADNKTRLEEASLPRVWWLEYTPSANMEGIPLILPSDIIAVLRGKPSASQYIASLVRSDMGR